METYRFEPQNYLSKLSNRPSWTSSDCPYILSPRPSCLSKDITLDTLLNLGAVLGGKGFPLDLGSVTNVALFITVLVGLPPPAEASLAYCDFAAEFTRLPTLLSAAREGSLVSGVEFRCSSSFLASLIVKCFQGFGVGLITQVELRCLPRGGLGILNLGPGMFLSIEENLRWYLPIGGLEHQFPYSKLSNGSAISAHTWAFALCSLVIPLKEQDCICRLDLSAVDSLLYLSVSISSSCSVHLFCLPFVNESKVSEQTMFLFLVSWVLYFVLLLRCQIYASASLPCTQSPAVDFPLSLQRSGKPRFFPSLGQTLRSW